MLDENVSAEEETPAEEEADQAEVKSLFKSKEEREHVESSEKNEWHWCCFY